MTVAGFDRRDLTTTWNFFRMFVRDRFLGSRLGSVWALLSPALMLLTFTFVFGFVFKAKLPGADTTLAYATWLIAGYGPWLAITEALNTSSQSLVASSGMIKNMAFKTECLPIAGSMVGLIPLVVSVAFVLVLLVIDGNPPTFHALLVFPAIVLGFLFIAALGIGFAALTVFLRDFAVMLPTLLTVLLFASPILYPLEAMPAVIRSAAEWNPFYILAELIRGPLVFHTVPAPGKWLYLAVVTVFVGTGNLVLFRRLKGSFSSVL